MKSSILFASIFLCLTVCSVNAFHITLTLSPDELVADGVNTFEINATVFDSAGFPVSDGTPVTFYTLAGLCTLHASMAYTDGGEATTTGQTICGEGFTGEDTVVATAFASVSDSHNVLFIPDSTPYDISFISPIDTITLIVGDDYLDTVYVQVTDSCKNPARTGYLVNFSGTCFSVSPPTFPTDGLGIAWTRIEDSRVAGVCQLFASIGTISDTLTVVIRYEHNYYVFVNLHPTSCIADGITTFDILVDVVDSFYEYVSDSTEVIFSSTMSRCSFFDTITYTIGGRASTTGQTICGPGYTGEDTITATVFDSFTGSQAVIFVPGEPYEIEFIYPTDTVFLEVNYDAEFESVGVQLRDSCGNPVEPGLRVDFHSYPLYLAYYTPYAATGDLGIAYGGIHGGSSTGVGIFIASRDSIADTIPIKIIDTGIEETNGKLMRNFTVEAFPNPFNESISFEIDLGLGTNTGVPFQIEIHDIYGRVVLNDRQDFDDRQDACLYKWQPKPYLPSGIYLVKVSFGKESRINKILFLK